MFIFLQTNSQSDDESGKRIKNNDPCDRELTFLLCFWRVSEIPRPAQRFHSFTAYVTGTSSLVKRCNSIAFWGGIIDFLFFLDETRDCIEPG